MPFSDHDAEYKPAAWKQYTLEELGKWVHLLAMRAEHRMPGEKREKDLYDAQNYLDMMQEKLNSLK